MTHSFTFGHHSFLFRRVAERWKISAFWFRYSEARGGGGGGGEGRGGEGRGGEGRGGEGRGGEGRGGEGRGG